MVARTRSFKPENLLLTALLAFTAIFVGGCSAPPATSSAPTLIKPLVRPPANPWHEAIEKVREDRGEPTGNEAQITVPPELKHYDNPRRFLAVQVAEWRKQGYELPADYAELVEMIVQKEFVPMKPLGEEYILFGVGESADDGPFTHYERATGARIPLYATFAEFEAEHNRLAETVKQYQSDMKLVRAQLRKASRRERQLRAELRAKLAATQKAIAEANKEARLLASFYKSPVRRKLLEAKYEQVAKLAADFEGQAYNLQEADDRKRMKARLLSYVRPEARDALTEIAQAYKGKFDRWLPITSLVRTEEYQRQLSRTNRNATRIETPPHATGLAFDIYNRHMTAAEQDFLMAEIARMEAAGRLEALRENRDHIHVFVFPEGHPPDEALITNSIKNLNSPASFKPSAGKERNHKTGEADLRAGR